jgi:integrase
LATVKRQHGQLEPAVKNSKNDWPKIVKVGNAAVKIYKRITASGNVGFQIVFWDIDGERKFESCSNETETMERARQKAEILSTFGAKVAAMRGSDIAEFVRLTDLLKPHGVTVSEVVTRADTWLRTHRTLEAIDRALVGVPKSLPGQVVARTVAELVEEIIARKAANGASEFYINDLKCRLRRFKKDFQCDLGTVTTAQIQNWLKTQKLEATNYNNFRRILHVLFEFGLARGYCVVNPVTKIESRKQSFRETQIYTPAEMTKLLTAASPEFLPMLAICGFAGVRTQEFQRMTWANVDFDGGHIILESSQTKTTLRRVIPMSENLRVWLLPSKGRTGKIWTDGTLYPAQKNCAKLAGVTWKGNALRHSFCSYRLALTHNVEQVADEAGNSATMIHRHNKALVTEQSARDWFAITPTISTQKNEKPN